MGLSSRRLDPFRLLYHAHVDRVRRLVSLAGVRDADIADVMQNIFLSLYRATQRDLDTSAPLEGWLRKAAFRAARDWNELARGREQPAAGEALELTEIADLAMTPEDHAMTIDAWANARATLDQLRPELRRVLVMSDVEEMPMREIAEVEEIPVKTGYTRLYAGRKAFADAWQRRLANEHAAVAPFALWDAQSVLAAAKATPPAPSGLREEVWRRLCEALGPGLTGATAVGTAGAALGAKHVAVGVVLAALAAAGLYAAAHRVLDGNASRPVAGAAREGERGVEGEGAPLVASAVSVDVGTTAQPGASQAAPPLGEDDASERVALQNARAALDQRKPAAARAALMRVKSARFASQREELWHAALAMEHRGP